MVEVDAAVVVGDSVAFKGVVAGIVEVDAVAVVAGCVASYVVIAAGIPEADAFVVVAGCVVCDYTIFRLKKIYTNTCIG